MAAPAVYKSASRGVPFTLQAAATTGNGNIAAIPPSFTQHRVTIEGSAGVGAGAIQVESAQAPDYAGTTWNPIGGAPVTVVANGVLEVTFSGNYGAIRARISTNVTGGTVTCRYTGS